MADDNPTPRVTAAPDPPRPARPRLPGPARRWLRRARRWRYGIGARLALLAFALGLPFIAYVGVNAARQASIERDEAKQHTLSLARLFAARVDDYVGDVTSALALVDHGASLDPASGPANDAFLQRIRPDLPRSIDNVGV